MRWIPIVLVACGAQPPPPAPIAKPAPPVGKPAAITCGDVAVILRGPVDDDRNAGPMKEEAIAKACLHDAWPRDVIECVGGTVKPLACLDKLDADQRSAYRKRISDWHESFPFEAMNDDLPADVADDKIVYVACADAIGDVSQYAPVLTLKGNDRELATAMRRRQVLALCDDWPTETRKCFEAKPSSQCRLTLEPDQEQELVDRLAEIDALMAKIAATKSADCKKVVEVHYADARWTGKLALLKPAERKKLIAASRTAMTKACADEKWNASLRACIAVQGGDACFTAAGITPATWGFPATSVPMKTGIPECDAYGDVLRALATCTAIPRQAAQSMLDSYRQTVPIYLNMGAGDRGAAARSCAQADSSIRQSAKNLGCTI